VNSDVSFGIAMGYVLKACLQLRYLAIDVLLFRAFASAGIYLPSLCLAMGIHVTILGMQVLAVLHKFSGECSVIAALDRVTLISKKFVS
jgi:hypothetical protein